MIKIKDINGEVIHSGDFKTDGQCVVDAVEKGITLRGADLAGINLVQAPLREADFEGANLSYAMLKGANLEGANLFDANLKGAVLNYSSLSYANLWHANMGGVHLKGALGSNHRVSSIQVHPYTIVVLDNERVWAGCTSLTIEEWLSRDKKHMSEVESKYYQTVTLPFLTMIKARKDNA